MDSLTRRRFLVRSGVVGGAALAAGAGVYALADILATAGHHDTPAGAGSLVLVTLYGGNDGLNTVIPYADSAYHDARPDLAYRPEEVLRLDDAIGLNPGLAGLAAQYRAGRLAIVSGVEYPKPDHSHFRSMDIWQTASPANPANTGWLGRWLDQSGADPRLAVSFEPVLPVVLAGHSTAGAVVPVGGEVLPRGTGTADLRDLGVPSPGEPPMQARAARGFADLVAVDAMLATVPAASPAPAATGDPQTPAATGTGGQSALAGQLDLVARCVEAGVATRAYSVSLGGFDTHADERAAQQRLLTELDTAVSGFITRMAGSTRGRGVVVLIYSEFGRRVRANASQGTDHGTASDMFLLGAGVHGGRYGKRPSLTDLDNGDLKAGTDFRDVYAAVLRGTLGTDPARVLDGWTGHLEGVLG